MVALALAGGGRGHVGSKGQFHHLSADQRSTCLGTFGRSLPQEASRRLQWRRCDTNVVQASH